MDAPATTMTERGWDEALPTLRERLVRRARRLDADPASAEDLAQEALCEAWRLRGRVYDPAGIDRWLSAILTNVHLRQARRRGREASFVDGAAGGSGAGAERADGCFDVEVELERHELAELLDRAMALLPQDTRDVLVQRFIEDTPIGELAGRSGMSPGAVRMRLQRGKLALRQVLTTTYADDALSYGLITDGEAGWRATRIWCPLCGKAQLRGRFRGPHREMEVACPLGCECSVMADDRIYGGVRGFRPALKRTIAFSYEFFRDVLHGLGGRESPARVRPGFTPRGMHAVWADAPHSGRVMTVLSGHALGSPEGLRFWREHPRIRMAAYREIEAEGRPAVLVGFASAACAARLDAVLARDSLRVVRASRH
jgi:RNA polymerase sigma factor (sigma-70 family)